MASVIVLSGGTSDEREVSLRSGSAVAAALQAAGHTVSTLDPADGLEPRLEELKSADVVFPVLHGLGGEDGVLQKQLDEWGLCYVGTGAEASALCFDKWQFKQLMQGHDLPNPVGELVDEAAFRSSALTAAPYVLKPNDGGSSVDTIIKRAETPDPHAPVIHDLFERHGKMLLEELVSGTEITVAVLGERALPVIEIIPPPSGEFDYENKYNGASQELCPPKNVEVPIQERAQQLALQVHQLAGCRDFSRTDFMIDSDGQLYILETNTIPGMTNQSLFPKAAAAAGLSFERLVDELVQMALARTT
jgi:D-alanine-D-alanine ligase